MTSLHAGTGSKVARARHALPDVVRRNQARRGTLLAGASLASLLLCGPALADKWSPSLDALGRAGSDQGGGALDLLVPLYQDDDTLLFGNALGGLDSDTSTGTSLGLGLRLQLDESVIVGGYVFGDWLRTSHDNAFFQVTGGLEVMTEDWDLRVTGYLPLTSERLVAGRSAVDGTTGSGGIGVGTGTLEVHDDELGIQWEGIDGAPGVNGFKDQEALLAGGEAEVGYKLPLDHTLGKNWEVRTYFGGYYFSAEDYDTFAGPRARVELRAYDLSFLGDGARVTLGAEASWDDPRGVTGAGLLRVRIPLGWFTGERKELTPLDRRMVDPIPRRITPFTDQRHEVLVAAAGSAGGGAFEAVESLQTGNDTMTGHEITKVYFASGTSGGQGAAGDSGFAADPTDLDSAVTRAGAGGMVVVLGGAGTLEAPVAGVELQQNQIVIGGTTIIPVQGVISNAAFSFDPGDFSVLATRPTINSNIAAGTFGVTLGTAMAAHSGTWVQGLDVTLGNVADVRIGVFHEDSSNHLVRDVNVTGGVIAFGADTSTGGTANVDNISFDSVSSSGSAAGLYIFNNAGAGAVSNISLTSATFTNTSPGAVGASILVASDNAEHVTGLTFTNVMVVNAATSGMQLANVQNVTITNVTLGSSGAAGNGLIIQSSVNDNNQNITVDGLSVTGFGVGMQLGELSNASFSNLTLTDNRQFGVELVGSTGVTFDTGTIIGTGTMAAMTDAAFRITNSTNVTVTDIAIDGQTAGGTQVTEQGFVVTGTLGVGSVTLNSGASTGNTTTHIAADCAVAIPANVTGNLTYDDLDDVAPAVTCPP